MDTHDKISVKEAQNTFVNTIRSLNENDKRAFLTYIYAEWRPSEILNSPNSENRQASEEDWDSSYNLSSSVDFKDIIKDIKNMVPFDAILPSEHIAPPLKGQHAHCDSRSTMHVDAFLYDDEDVSELIDEGKLANNYCVDCGSKNIESTVFISHSMSVESLVYVFKKVLPCLHNKTVLDIGSRLGAVLYGAFRLSDAERIIGVEMNEEFCELQSKIIKKYNMEDRIEIVNKRIEECPEIVRNSDVIIINNAFEFYLPGPVQTEIWRFLKANIKKGTILITFPPIGTALKDLETGISINDWLEAYNSNGTQFSDEMEDDEKPYPEMGYYQIL